MYLVGNIDNGKGYAVWDCHYMGNLCTVLSIFCERKTQKVSKIKRKRNEIDVVVFKKYKDLCFPHFSICLAPVPPIPTWQHMFLGAGVQIGIDYIEET